MDETMQALVTGVTTEGFTDHFHGKGQKTFAPNYLELWEKVRPAWLSAVMLIDRKERNLNLYRWLSWHSAMYADVERSCM